MNKKIKKTISDKVNKGNVSNFLNIFRIQIYKYFSSLNTYITVFLFPLVITFISVEFLPNYLTINILINGSLMVSTFFIFGFYFIDTTKITYFSSLKIKNEKYFIIGSTFLLVSLSNIFISFISIFYVFFLSSVLGSLDLTSFFNTNILIELTFNEARWIPFIYYITLQNILLFSIALFIFTITKKTTKYFFCVSFFLVFAFFFGGIIFSKYYDLIGKLSINNETSFESNEIFIKNNEIWILPSVSKNEFNLNMIISSFFPTYFLNQFGHHFFSNIYLYIDDNVLQNNEIYINGFEIQDVTTKININYFNVSSWSWILVIFIPYFWIILFFVLNSLLYQDGKNK